MQEQTLTKLVSQASDGDAHAAKTLQTIATAWSAWHAAIARRVDVNKATKDMLIAADQNLGNSIEEGQHFSASDDSRIAKLVRIEKAWQSRTEQIAHCKDLRFEVKEDVSATARRLEVSFEDVNQMTLPL